MSVRSAKRAELLDAVLTRARLRLGGNWDPGEAQSVIYDCGLDSTDMVELLVDSESIVGRRIDQVVFLAAITKSPTIFADEILSWATDSQNSNEPGMADGGMH